MTAYCDRQSVELNSIAFLFDGRRLRGEQTPDEVKLLSHPIPESWQLLRLALLSYVISAIFLFSPANLSKREI